MTTPTTSTRSTTTTTRRAALAVVLALGLAACGGDDDASDAADAAGGEEVASAGADGTDDEEAAGTDADDAGEDDAPVTTASSDLGEILVTADGFTVYGFTNDEQGGASACTEGCLGTWPPVLVEGGQLPAGLDAAVFGVLERADGGGTQLTADGWPLYTYAPDTEPGDVNGQGVGEVWWVVAPDGTLVTDG